MHTSLFHMLAKAPVKSLTPARQKAAIKLLVHVVFTFPSVCPQNATYSKPKTAARGRCRIVHEAVAAARGRCRTETCNYVLYVFSCATIRRMSQLHRAVTIASTTFITQDSILISSPKATDDRPLFLGPNTYVYIYIYIY